MDIDFVEKVTYNECDSPALLSEPISVGKGLFVTMNVQERVQEVLDKLRPYIQRDGGDVELVEISDDGIVRVRLLGACGSCPSSTITLKAGIERALMEEIPEVREVEQVL
ncbi:Fe-S cluster biogenesis protein NfuA [Laceyella sacchari]|jgi:Fe-S cluster biogenesis protein NfuA|nr:Fe-S cluster biogenesis protein NfuA [Laceyella sacchari]